MLNREMELHDSQVDAIVAIGGQVIVFFSRAYIHQSEGRPGWDAGSGWVQTAVLMWKEAVIKGAVPEFPAYIQEGALRVDAEEIEENTIPIPFARTGTVTLTVRFLCAVEAMIIRGTQAELTLLGEAVYVEEFPGA